MKKQLNVFGKDLIPCSLNPLTGFSETVVVKQVSKIKSLHNICVTIDQKFLEFSKNKGNDLITPREEYSFKGLKPGDKWCVL